MSDATLSSADPLSSDATAEAVPAAPANPGASIDYNYFLDCVHCGLCTAACPTYAELGNENDSPRGRIYLMRAVTDKRLPLDQHVRRHLELCLDCRACETACPSGVQYGKLIEPFRVNMESSDDAERKTNDWFHQWILFWLFPNPQRLKLALWPARLAQKLRLDRLVMATGLWKLLPPRLGRLLTMLPPLDAPLPPLENSYPAKGDRRARVALFTGCVGDAVFRPTHMATVRVLQENGCEVVVPPAQRCCGAIHFHAGQAEPAQDFADQNLAAFTDPEYADVDAILVNVAGCGAMLKDY